MKKIIFMFLLLGIATACSSDDDSSNSSKTKAIIKLQDSDGEAVSNVMVYAYEETTWEVIGDQTNFADYQAASNNNGEAIFENIHSETAFSELNNYQNTFRFSAHYTLNETEKTKVVSITFNKGDTKTETLILN